MATFIELMVHSSPKKDHLEQRLTDTKYIVREMIDILDRLSTVDVGEGPLTLDNAKEYMIKALDGDVEDSVLKTLNESPEFDTKAMRQIQHLVARDAAVRFMGEWPTMGKSMVTTLIMKSIIGK